MKLEGISAIVTGGGKNVGRAITLALAKEGADVAIVARNDKKSAEETALEVEQLGRRAIPLLADITRIDLVDNLIQDVVTTFGKIDLLVNNAGWITYGPLEEISVEDWDTTVAVNLKGVFLCSVAAAKEMMKRDGGNIVNITGASAHRCIPGNGAFGPSKAAVVNLTRQMALEWAEHNIRVNDVSPGPISIGQTIKLEESEDIKQRISKIPLGRVGTPEEVANAVVFLASSDASYTTGHSFIVDGGGVHTWYLYP